MTAKACTVKYKYSARHTHKARCYSEMQLIRKFAASHSVSDSASATPPSLLKGNTRKFLLCQLTVRVRLVHRPTQVKISSQRPIVAPPGDTPPSRLRGDTRKSPLNLAHG